MFYLWVPKVVRLQKRRKHLTTKYQSQVSSVHHKFCNSPPEPSNYQFFRSGPLKTGSSVEFRISPIFAGVSLTLYTSFTPLTLPVEISARLVIISYVSCGQRLSQPMDLPSWNALETIWTGRYRVVFNLPFIQELIGEFPKHLAIFPAFFHCRKILPVLGEGLAKGCVA